MPGVTAVSEIRAGTGEVSARPCSSTASTASLTEVLDIDWARGSEDVPAGLGRDGAIVTEDFAESNALRSARRCR